MTQKLTIYYGTQTGNAELVAMDASDLIAAAGVEVDLCALDEVTPDDLESVDHPFVLISSTYDDGDLPDNAEEFYSALLEADLDLSGLSYAVLGLGDSSYDDFCGAARKLDERIAALGAQAFWPRLDCDVDFEVPAKAWTERLLARLTGADEEPAAAAAESTAEAAATKVERHSPRNPYVATVSVSRRLSGEGSDKSVHHVELTVDPDGFVVHPGDSVGVLVRNAAPLVEEALQALGLDGDAESAEYGTTWRTALTERLELRLPSRELVELARTHAADATSDEHLHGGLGAWLYGKDVVDLALLVPAAERAGVLATLRPLAHREYSVASSRAVDPTRVALMVSRVEYEAQGRSHRGAGSVHVTETLAEGDEVQVFEVPTATFKLPASDVDVVMVGPGTGVAPFRAFLAERAATGATGRNWLFFGDRREEHDHAYRAELEQWASDGVLTRLETAFSRDGAEKVYVQHRMREHGKELWSWLAEGGSFYVCGDMSEMAPAVEEALLEIAAEHGGTDAEGARTWLDDLRRQRRYLKDVY